MRHFFLSVIIRFAFANLTLSLRRDYCAADSKPSDWDKRTAIHVHTSSLSCFSLAFLLLLFTVNNFVHSIVSSLSLLGNGLQVSACAYFHEAKLRTCWKKRLLYKILAQINP